MARTIGITEEESERILELSGKSTHSAWLTFMYPRLILARDLLADDGAIFISIDNNEYHNLKLVCDEIFGEENFINTIIWNKKYGTQNDAKFFSTNHDYILVYAKQIEHYNLNLLPRRDQHDKRYTNRDNDPRGPWKAADFTVPHVSENRQYPIKTPSGKIVYPSEGRSWNGSKEDFKALVEDNRIWFGVNGDSIPSKKTFLSEVKSGITASTIWGYEEVGHTDSANRELKDIFSGKAYFDYPKSVELIKRIITLSSNKDSLILDFFAGSSTTAQAVMEKNAEDCGNRKYIMVQLPEKIEENKPAYKAGYRTIDEIGRERIKRASKKIKEETGADIDYGFKLFYLETPEEKTLADLEEFEPEIKLLSDDMISIFDNDHSTGKESIFATWLNEDGYTLTRSTENYKLKNYKANLMDKSLYLIDESLESDDVMALIKRIEEGSLDISRVVIYVHSLTFNVLQELRKNLKVLKNNKNVTLIERF